MCVFLSFSFSLCLSIFLLNKIPHTLSAGNLIDRKSFVFAYFSGLFTGSSMVHLCYPCSVWYRILDSALVLLMPYSLGFEIYALCRSPLMSLNTFCIKTYILVSSSLKLIKKCGHITSSKNEKHMRTNTHIHT